MGIIQNITKNEAIKENGKTMLEDLASAILEGDVIALGRLIKCVFKSPYFIREQIFWQNFIEYLDNACADEEQLRKLSEKLAEDGDSFENAKRIIKIIDDAGTRKKSLYISNLTRACCMELISLSKFFKLSQCINRLTDEDLDFLSNNISRKRIDTDEEYIDDFRNCGLLKEVAGGFVYTKRAYELKKYSLRYDQDVKIPEIPERQMQSDLTLEDVADGDIDAIINGSFKE